MHCNKSDHVLFSWPLSEIWTRLSAPQPEKKFQRNIEMEDFGKLIAGGGGTDKFIAVP